MSSNSILNDKFIQRNTKGDITCAICKIPIKNIDLWQRHIQGTIHKEKYALQIEILHKRRKKHKENCIPISETTKDKEIKSDTSGIDATDGQKEPSNVSDTNGKKELTNISNTNIQKELQNTTGINGQKELSNIPRNNTDEIQPTNPVTNLKSLLTYSDDDDEDEHVTDTQNDAVNKDTADQIYDSENSDIEIPDSWDGDPDEYIEQEMARRKKQKKKQQEQDDEIVEIIDDDNNIWILQNDDFIYKGKIDNQKNSNSIDIASSINFIPIWSQEEQLLDTLDGAHENTKSIRIAPEHIVEAEIESFTNEQNTEMQKLQETRGKEQEMYDKIRKEIHSDETMHSFEDDILQRLNEKKRRRIEQLDICNNTSNGIDTTITKDFEESQDEDEAENSDNIDLGTLFEWRYRDNKDVIS